MAIAVIVTIPEEKAEELSKIILQERLCACVNIVKGVNSYFWWNGKIDEAREAVLVIKSREELFSRLKTAIEHNHPYEVPEIIAFNIDRINDAYLAWLNKETNG